MPFTNLLCCQSCNQYQQASDQYAAAATYNHSSEGAVISVQQLQAKGMVITDVQEVELVVDGMGAEASPQKQTYQAVGNTNKVKDITDDFMRQGLQCGLLDRNTNSNPHQSTPQHAELAIVTPHTMGHITEIRIRFTKVAKKCAKYCCEVPVGIIMGPGSRHPQVLIDHCHRPSYDEMRVLACNGNIAYILENHHKIADMLTYTSPEELPLYNPINFPSHLHKAWQKTGSNMQINWH